jgi:hypothetical protein
MAQGLLVGQPDSNQAMPQCLPQSLPENEAVLLTKYMPLELYLS